MADQDKKEKKSDKKQIKLEFLIPLGALVLGAALLFSGIFSTPDNRLYDLYLHMKPDLEEDESILFLNIDEVAIVKIGQYPWSRDIIADGLVTMKEFDPAYAVFDIEYVEESSLGVNSQYLEEDLPELFSTNFETLRDNTRQLAQAVESGTLPLNAVPDFLGDLGEYTYETQDALLNGVRQVARNNDLYLGQAVRYFENAFLTVNMLDYVDEDIDDEHRQWVLENLSLDTVSGAVNSLDAAEDLRAPIPVVIDGAAGAGFTNIIIDEDGVRRRVNLFRNVGDKIFAQLSIRPLLDILGNPDVMIGTQQITLKEAKLPDGTVVDISIPRDPDGKFLINWPKKQFNDSFRHLSFYYLYLHKEQEERLLHNLRVMDEAGYLSFYRGQSQLLDPYTYADSLKTEMLEGGDTSAMQEFRDVREFFFQELGAFLEGGAQEELTSQIDGALQTPNLSDEDREFYTQVKDDVALFFNNSREIYNNLMETRGILAENLKGSVCFIGWTGTSTTDRGVNPFSKEYDNVGTHASVMNTIMNRSFLDATPSWVSAVLSLVFAAAVFFSIRKQKPGLSLTIGVIYIIALVGGTILVFIFLGIYVALMTPLVVLGITFIGITIFQFLSTSKEKSFITNAFGRYLSGTVVNELIKNPENLQLGGVNRRMTACFTDIKGFSTISESLTPPELVKLLNIYLTRMSDIMMEEMGTIDKYEGDAIIAFYGAPVEVPDHAERAVRAAIRMKKAEDELNTYVREQNMAPSDLQTRIGINTGDMVVGNMGTANKMDYTIMGSSVNLASRLEGVNKQYGTWILISEPTWEAGGKNFVVRKLDRVRVVGIHEPVRLFEVVGEKGGVDDKILEALDIFERGLTHFEEKSWLDAESDFQKVLGLMPDDGPAKTFIGRCKQYEKNPPKKSWDGVFSLTSK